MVAAEILSGIGGLKAAFDIAQGLKNIDNTVRRNAAVIELSEKIIAAREAQSALLDRVGALEKEVAGFEAWEATKARYQLEKRPPGTFMYSLKKGMEEGEPPHHICAKCFEHRKRSILHSSGDEGGLEIFECFECKSKFHVGRLRGWSRPADDDDNTSF
jgi:hypothetical protein